MFCQKCGAELTKDALFCIKCGAKAPVVTDFGQPQQNTLGEGADDKLSDAVVRFQNGERSAFDTIYNESSRYVYYTILKTTGDKEVADDILQETYLDVYKSLDQLQTPAAFKGWAAKIAQHKISHYYRKKAPELFSSEEEMDDSVGDLTEEDMEALPEDAMINKEVQRLITEIIDELPQNQKSAVISYFYNQMSISEIAESMGVPENTVKTYLFRGKKKIKDGVLEIEKKHGTKLYALPLAGLLGLLFTEEAKAAVVTTAASQVLSAASSAGSTAITGTTVTSSAAVSSSAVSSTTAGATTVSSASTSAVSTAHSTVSKTVSNSGSIGKRVAAASVKTAEHAARSSVRTVIISAAAGLVVGSTSAVVVTQQIYEKKIVAIQEEYENVIDDSEIASEPFVGKWEAYEDGYYIRLEMKNDNTFIVEFSDTDVKGSGGWSTHESEITLDFVNWNGNAKQIRLKYDDQADILSLYADSFGWVDFDRIE